MILIDIFFDILISVGPFYIFKGMGTGKDSGKLLFRSLTSSNSSVIFGEDQNGLTFSSNATSENVPSIFLNNLIEGTGNCIKAICYSPRRLLVDNRQNYESIVGVGKWNSKTQSSNFNNLQTVCNNIIVGGCQNIITCEAYYSPDLCNSVILGGGKNKINGSFLIQYAGPNLIVSGCCNQVCQGFNSSIIGGYGNNFTTIESFSSPISAHSTIISSTKTQLNFGGRSSVVTSTKNNLDISDGLFGTPSISSRLHNTNIMSSSKIITNEPIFDKLGVTCEGKQICNLQVLSSKSIFISTCQNSILSSTGSFIVSTQSSGDQNLLISSELSIFCDAEKSMIISSSDVDIRGCSKASNNFIIASRNSYIGNDSCSDCCLRNNSIINSSYAFIYSCDLSPNCMKTTCGNSIISSSKACIYNSQNSMIILSSNASSAPFGTPSVFRDCNSVVSSSFGSKIFSTQTQTSKNNIVLGSIISCIELSCNSAIISSSETEITCTKESVIINSQESSIRSTSIGTVDNNLIMSSPKSGIARSSGNAKRNVVLSGCCNVIADACDSSIIAGCENCLYNSINSTIIAGQCNVLDVCNLTGNSIIGGYCNKIFSKPIHSVIIGGYKNYICGDTGFIGQAIIGGQCIENRIDRSTMVPILVMSDSYYNPNRKVWMCGFTGSSGVFNVGSGSIRVCNGLVIGI